MLLKSANVQMFRNFTNTQDVKIEPNVTGLIGKNESGKTTLLRALHRLKPANNQDQKFNLGTEYPRWRVAQDRRKGNLEDLCPIEATFELTDEDVRLLSEHLGVKLPENISCVASRSYSDELGIRFESDWAACRDIALGESTVSGEYADKLRKSISYTDAIEIFKALSAEAKQVKDTGATKSLKSFETELEKLAFLHDASKVDDTTKSYIAKRLPRFFYFSSYENLPGECNLTQLAEKIGEDERLSPEEQTVVSLLSRAGASPEDFLSENYDERKAELQAVGLDISNKVFDYWTQNSDLEVRLDTDTREVRGPQGQITGYDRILKIELSDGRHGGIVTNFSTRSTGFQWFFSFFAAFTEYQDAEEPIVVLLDEPGLSLHGEAQKDFLKFIYEELGANQQTIYTTHSQFMVDPAKYENLRAVHDTASRDNREGGVRVSDVSLSADRNTVLPVESSLGYSISQHLFIGSGHHLAVEGSSDFVYLQRMSEYLEKEGKTGLDPKFSIIPVGGADNLPAFVALLGRRLKVTALVDGSTTSKTAERIRAASKANELSQKTLVVCSETVDGLPRTADVEDVFHINDYKLLYEWGFGDGTFPTLQESSEPILRRLEIALGRKFDHAIPAHALTDNREEFFKQLHPTTITNFEHLFKKLNLTIGE